MLDPDIAKTGDFRKFEVIDWQSSKDIRGGSRLSFEPDFVNFTNF